MANQKGMSNLLGVGIIVTATIIIAGIVLAWQYGRLFGEKMETQVEDWETYRNEEHGYEVKYPSGEGIKVFQMEGGRTDLRPRESWEPLPGSEGGWEPERLEIKIEDFVSKSLEDYIVKKFELTNPSFNITKEKIKPAVIGGISSFSLVVYQEGDRYVWAENYVVKNERLYNLSCLGGKKFIELCDKMISTFRFVELTSNLKTYANQKYGYEIKYPSDWAINFDRLTEEFINFYPSSLNEKPASFPYAPDPKLTNGIIIQVIKPGEAFQEYIQQQIDRNSFTNKKEIKIGTENYSAIEVINFESIAPLKNIFLDGGSFFLSISIMENSSYMPVFEELLSVFRFIEESSGEDTDTSLVPEKENLIVALPDNLVINKESNTFDIPLAINKTTDQDIFSYQFQFYMIHH